MIFQSSHYAFILFGYFLLFVDSLLEFFVETSFGGPLTRKKAVNLFLFMSYISFGAPYIKSCRDVSVIFPFRMGVGMALMAVPRMSVITKNQR